MLTVLPSPPDAREEAGQAGLLYTQRKRWGSSFPRGCYSLPPCSGSRAPSGGFRKMKTRRNEDECEILLSITAFHPRLVTVMLGNPIIHSEHHLCFSP